MLGMLLHGVFVSAFTALSMPGDREGDSAPLGGAGPEAIHSETIDVRLEQDICFSRVMGVRFGSAKQFLRHPLTKPTLVTLSLGLEPLRHLSAWWMRLAGNPSKCRNAMFDILWEPTSPLTHATQYLASIPSATVVGCSSFGALTGLPRFSSGARSARVKCGLCAERPCC
jgi:hypothetical protein